MKQDVHIRLIQQSDLRELWEISYGPRADLEWKKWDGPYFKDPILNWIEFSTSFGERAVGNVNRGVILYHDQIVGTVTSYWEDGQLKQ